MIIIERLHTGEELNMENICILMISFEYIHVHVFRWNLQFGGGGGDKVNA